MTQKDLTILTKYINIILDNSLDSSVNIHLHDIAEFCRINLVNEIDEKELDRIAIEEANKIPLLDPKDGKNVTFYKGYKAGYHKAMKHEKSII